MANVPPAKLLPKKKSSPLRSGQNIDYKDTATLRKFISERGKIRARRVTGLSAGAAPGRHCHQERPRGCAAAVRLDGSLSQENDDMKLILTAAVDKLGLAGDVVEVKDGYGRNYLVPRGFAIRWTKGGEKQIDGIKEPRCTRDPGHGPCQEIRTQLEGLTIELPVRAGETGKLSVRSLRRTWWRRSRRPRAPPWISEASRSPGRSSQSVRTPWA